MNRRSILRLLGLAPIATPVALAMGPASTPALPAIDYAGLDGAVARQIEHLTALEARICATESRIVDEAMRRAVAQADQTRLISAVQASQADVERLRLALTT